MRSADAILGELEIFGIRLGLESTSTLLAALGDPQSRPRVVLVSGTNGKGSTSSLLAQILHAAGLRVGLYTSPHLEEVEERIRVGGRVIASDALAAKLERVVAIGRETLGHPPTYFEALTVAAYWHFAEECIDVAVMEVGLGGRLDATNAAEPVLSIVTGISLDHVKVLGSTLDSIAREKAGILRAGRTALHGVAPAQARAALEEEALRKGALLLDAAALATVEDVDRSGAARRVVLRTPTAEHRLTVGMRGAYQSRNLRLAVLAAEILREEQGLAIDAGAIERGARDWRWPGRCELVALPDGREVLLDAAHNEEGIASLRAELASGWPGDAERPRSPWRLVFGALDDKPAAAMVRAIARDAEQVILVRPPSPRGVDPRELQSAVPDSRASIAADTVGGARPRARPRLRSRRRLRLDLSGRRRAAGATPPLRRAGSRYRSMGRRCRLATRCGRHPAFPRSEPWRRVRRRAVEQRWTPSRRSCRPDRYFAVPSLPPEGSSSCAGSLAGGEGGGRWLRRRGGLGWCRWRRWRRWCGGGTGGCRRGRGRRLARRAAGGGLARRRLTAARLGGGMTFAFRLARAVAPLARGRTRGLLGRGGVVAQPTLESLAPALAASSELSVLLAHARSLRAWYLPRPPLNNFGAEDGAATGVVNHALRSLG